MFSNGKTSCQMPEGFTLGPKESNHDTVLLYDHHQSSSSSSPVISPVGGKETTTVRVLAFDFDETLISSTRGSSSYELRFEHVVASLRKIMLDSENSSSPIVTKLAIVTNESLGRYVKEGALEKYLVSKCSKLKSFCHELDLDVVVLMPTAKDFNRKGVGGGCWALLESVLLKKMKSSSLNEVVIDKSKSMYVGDASGEGNARRFNSTDVDKIFADHAGVRFSSEKTFFVGGGRRDLRCALNGQRTSSSKLVTEHAVNGISRRTGASLKRLVQLQ
jgi:DNA 3'-phosphatase